MLTMGMLERYVLKRTMGALVGALAVLSAMVMLIAFVDGNELDTHAALLQFGRP